MSKLLHSVYALAAYVVFLAVFLGLVGFVADLPLPRTLDRGPAAPAAQAVAIDLLLVALFGLQHSVMARAGFKAWWTRIVPRAVERSTYVLAASAMLALTMWQWRPITAPLLWDLGSSAAALALETLRWAGWGVVLLSTFLIDHFELFGLRQAHAGLVGRRDAPPSLRTPLLYRHVRHPIYLGFLVAFWATPRMTPGHALFACACTAYILVGIRFEERDLVDQFGDRYRHYRERVGMLLPSLRRSQR